MECIARFGLFDEMVSDNGTQFVAGTIKTFLSAKGIKQTLTSPGHPSTNGEAENMVKTFKATLIKSLSEGDKDVRGIVAIFFAWVLQSRTLHNPIISCTDDVGAGY